MSLFDGQYRKGMAILWVLLLSFWGWGVPAFGGEPEPPSLWWGVSLSDTKPFAGGFFLEGDAHGLALRGFLDFTMRTQEAFVGAFIAPVPPRSLGEFAGLTGIGYAYALGPIRRGARYILFVTEISYLLGEGLALLLTGKVFSPATCCVSSFHWVSFGVKVHALAVLP